MGTKIVKVNLVLLSEITEVLNLANDDNSLLSKVNCNNTIIVNKHVMSHRLNIVVILIPNFN